jgi:hypothetical protein
MSWRLVTGGGLAVLGACAEPMGEPGADDEPSSFGAQKSTAGAAGRGGSASGGSKALGTSGSAGKAPIAGKPATVGVGGAGDAGEPGLEPESGGEPTTNDPGPTTQTGDLSLQYRAGNSSANDNQIGAHLRIVSSALAPLELSALSARYYFTSEPAPPLTIEIYTTAAEGASGYRALPAGSVIATAHETYVELTFTAAAGILDAGGQVTIEIAIHDTGWVGLFDETDDYSFNGAHSSFAAWERVTLYDVSTLVWGIEP